MSKPKLKTCKAKNCSNKFTPFNSIEQWCSPACGWAISKEKQAKAHAAVEKAERQEHVKRKKALKSRQEWLKEAQAAFNAYIRARDADLPCICCNRHYEGQYHAGHYLSVGAHPELRFNEDNCHKQKSSCNNYKSGNITKYRIWLIKKIGIDKVEWLEGPHELQKLTIEQIKDIKALYKQKLKELDNG